jgi:hypothetical protein
MRGFSLSRRDCFVLGAAALLCLAAWGLPRSKPAAVAGRLNYIQFVLALLATSLLVCVTVVVLLPPARRRLASFRAAAIWLGSAAAILAWEGAALLCPQPHEMNNPWYLFTAQGISAGDDLPFERPPHLRWEGLSHGDLAILNQEKDPYARPVTFVTDHEGFRNGQDLTQADLVFIGDSFTEAGNMPEDDTFVQRTAAALGRSARNLGRVGHTGPSELVILRKYGLKCRPKTVIWQFAEDNDLVEAILFQKWVDNGRPSYLRTTPMPKVERERSWMSCSPTWRLFRCFRRPRPWPLRGTFQERDGEMYEVRFSELPAAKHSPLNHPGWPLLARSLRQGAQLLGEKNVQMLVLLIPMKTRVLGHSVTWNPDVQTRLRSDWDVPEVRSLAAYLRRLCEELEVPFVDATLVLRAAAARGDLVYLPLDTHLSAKGHRVVSTAIVEALRAVRK